MTALISDFLDSGLLAARPVTPAVPAGTSAIYYATDTDQTFMWTGAGWQQISGAAGAPVVVQSKVKVYTGVNITPAITMDAAPTAGNLLVAIQTNTSSAAPNAAQGWQLIANSNAGSAQGNRVYAKVCGAGESATQTPTTTVNGALDILIWEVTNAKMAGLTSANFRVGSSAIANATVEAELLKTGAVVLLGIRTQGTANTPPSSYSANITTGASSSSSNYAQAAHLAAPVTGTNSANVVFAGNVNLILYAITVQ